MHVGLLDIILYTNIRAKPMSSLIKKPVEKDIEITKYEVCRPINADEINIFEATGKRKLQYRHGVAIINSDDEETPVFTLKKKRKIEGKSRFLFIY